MTLRLLAAVAIVSASPIFADSFSYTGHFTQDDDVVMFDFDLPAATSVTLRTWSFAGGMNAAGTLIPDDGLAPVLSLFDASGSEDLLATDRDGGPGACGPRSVDAVSHFCWDAYLNLSLAGGSYILALTEDDNSANGSTLADGFFRAGQGNFTPLVFGGLPNSSFILADGSQRTDAWAVDLIGVNVPNSSVPEPGSATLLWLCGPAMFLKSRNRRAYPSPGNAVRPIPKNTRLPGRAAQEGLMIRRGRCLLGLLLCGASLQGESLCRAFRVHRQPAMKAGSARTSLIPTR